MSAVQPRGIIIHCLPLASPLSRTLTTPDTQRARRTNDTGTGFLRGAEARTTNAARRNIGAAVAAVIISTTVTLFFRLLFFPDAMERSTVFMSRSEDDGSLVTLFFSIHPDRVIEKTKYTADAIYSLNHECVRKKIGRNPKKSDKGLTIRNFTRIRW